MKNLFRLSLAGALLTASAAFAIGAFQAISLHWTPKEGDTQNYVLNGTFQLQGQDAIIKSKTSYKVLRVDPDGSYTMQTSGSEGTLTAGGTEIPMQRTINVTHYKPNGDVIEMTGDNVAPDSIRFANLSNLRRPDGPVKIGDHWNVEVKVGGTVTVPVKGTFTLDSQEKVGAIDAYKIIGTLKEAEGATPGEIDSTYWVSTTDLSLVKYVSHWIDVQAPGASNLLTGTLTVTRVEPPPPAQAAVSH